MDRKKYEKKSLVKKYFVLTMVGQGLISEWKESIKSPFMKEKIINLKSLEEKRMVN